MNLQLCQREVLRRMLQGSTSDALSGQDTVWKLLIYDTYCRDILAPLFTVGELHKLGVTLHLLVTGQRERVPDVPAYYFIRPTKENIERVIRDLNQNLYDETFLFFSSSISAPLLKRLAQATALNKKHVLIKRVTDVYSEFQTVSSKLLTLGHKSSFTQLYGPRSSEDARSTYIDTIVNGLHNIILTTGVVPLIRCPPSGPATTIAQKLCDRLRQEIAEHPRLFENVNVSRESGGIDRMQRPLLVILDRMVDMTAPLHHPWTYWGLISDLIGITANRVTVVKDGQPTSLEIDFNDEFWISNCGQPIPAIAEVVDAGWSQYRRDLEAIQNKRANIGNNQLNDMTTDLSEQIDAVPALTRRKKQLEIHTNIGMTLVAKIKEREIDKLYALEEDILAGNSFNMTEFEKAIKHGQASFNDKIRLLLVRFLSTESMPPEKFNELAAHLERSIDDANLAAEAKMQPPTIAAVRALSYARRYVSDQHLMRTLSGASSSQSATHATRSHGSDGTGQGNSIFSQLTQAVLSSSVLTGLTNLVPKATQVPVTRIVSSLIDNVAANPSNETKSYLFLDPKLPAHRIPHESKTNTPFSQCIVFVAGGGSVTEHLNLQEMAIRKTEGGSPTSITYASTELSNPEEFLAILSEMDIECNGSKPIRFQSLSPADGSSSHASHRPSSSTSTSSSRSSSASTSSSSTDGIEETITLDLS